MSHYKNYDPPPSLLTVDGKERCVRDVVGVGNAIEVRCGDTVVTLVFNNPYDLADLIALARARMGSLR